MQIKHLTLGNIRTNCYIISDDNRQAAVIDPGFSAEKIIEAIEEDGLNLCYILLTHGHFDHIGAIKDLQEKYPHVKVAIGEQDAPMLLKASENSLARRFMSPGAFVGLKADIQLKDGDVVEVGDLRLAVIHTPGHTLGGVCFKVEDKLFTGDTLFYHECGRCDLEGGDYPTMLRSLRRLSELPGDYEVFPGHERFSTLQHERDHNRYMKEAQGQ